LLTAEEVRSKGYKKVGLLATDTTIRYQAYANDFEKNGIELVFPQNQKTVTNIILNIMAGRKLRSDKQALLKIVQDMKERGAEAVILACTELPLLISQNDADLPLFDTIEILARKTVSNTKVTVH
jgi:aspartate racemase